MSQNSTYLTVLHRSEGLYKEKGSKFIGIALPCSTADSAKEMLEAIRKEHHQARHFCYAYRFGLEGNLYRANDDGEPSNSAGAPILGQLQSFEVSNVLIVVVRYYGGTKLGVGGLINAYRTAAKDALENGEIVQREVVEWILIRFDYADLPSVMNTLKKHQLEQVDPLFELQCEVKTNLKRTFAEEIKSELNTLGSVEIDTIGIY